MEKRYLTTAILLSLAFTLLVPYVSSANYEWNQYGGNYYSGSQALPLDWKGSLLSSKYNINISSDMTIGFQPIVGLFNVSDPTNIGLFLYIQNDNYLQVYDSNLILVAEKNTGSSLGQMVLYDLYNDGSPEVLNLFKDNSTQYSFRVYSFSPYSNSLNVLEYYNITTDSSYNYTGTRCSNGCHFVLSNGSSDSTAYKVNSTGIFSNSLVGATKKYLKPPFFEYVDSTQYALITTGEEDSSNSELLIYETETGNIYMQKNYTLKAIQDAHFLRSDYGEPKVVVSFNDFNFFPQHTMISSYKWDGSTYKSDVNVFNYGGTIQMALSDFDLDGFDDVYYYAFSVFGGTRVNRYGILKGSTFNHLMSFDPVTTTTQGGVLTLADMNGDNMKDFIDGHGVVYVNFTNSSNSNRTFYVGDISKPKCVPSDFQFNGKLDLVCSTGLGISVFYSNYSNSLPSITTVTYDPSTTIPKESTLSVFIGANDIEGDTLFYSIKCSDSLSFGSESTSSTQSCYYADVGSYNLTVRVKDSFHTNYDYFSYTITVTSIGTVCGNYICETGETVSSCPLDCTTTPSQTQSSVNGSIVLPTQIVDVNNPETGLLPEVYYGTLGFLSTTLKPMMILIFGLFFVMIILAIGFIIKGFAGKVGNLMS